jgi:hypothetical protein
MKLAVGRITRTGRITSWRSASNWRRTLLRPGAWWARWLSVVFAISAAILMILPAQGPVIPGSSHATTASSPSPNANATGFLPYLLNTSTFSTSTNLLNASGGATLPQLTSTQLGNSTLFELAYVQSNSTQANHLAFASGEYNASLAQQAATGLGCTGSCSQQPIEWGIPSQVASFGKQNISADAIASSGNLVAVAAASGAYTSVFLSNTYGNNATWVNETAGGRLSGGAPRLALNPCGLIATTSTSTNLVVTVFTIPCHYYAEGASGGISQDTSTYAPTIASLTPSDGPSTVPVTIAGNHFWSGESTTFGGTTASSTYYNPHTIIATAPSGFSSGTPAPVQVTVNGTASQPSCGDIFTFENSIEPAISTVWPTAGPPGTLVTINGSTLYSNGPPPTVYFGSQSETATVVNDNQIQAFAPAGNGTVFVQEKYSGFVTPAYCNAEFTFNPGTPPPLSTNLPLADAAYPAWVTNPQNNTLIPSVLASNSLNSSIAFYSSYNKGISYRSKVVTPFNNSLGSAILSSIGSTRLVMSQGEGGQIVLAAEGTYLFGVFTSRVQGRVAIESVASSSSGTNWTGPYIVASYQGASADPEVSVSRSGYAYLTWRDDALGPWEVDSAVYSFAGQALQLPRSIPGSIESTGAGSGPPALAVDGFERPLFVWSSWNNSSDQLELRSSGGFLSPVPAVQVLRAAWNETVPSDFRSMSASALQAFRSSVNGSLIQLQTDVHSVHTAPGECTAENYLFSHVYPNVTTSDALPLVAGLAPTGCTFSSPATDASDLAAVQGPYTADSYLYVYLSWVAESLGRGVMVEPSWVGAPLGGEVNTYPNIGGQTPVYPFAPKVTGVDDQEDALTVDPVTINPNTLWLNASSRFSSGEASVSEEELVGQSWKVCGLSTRSDQLVAVNLSLAVSIPSSHLHVTASYGSRSQLPSVYVANLSSDQVGSWWENVSLTFWRSYSSTNSCSGTVKYSATVGASVWPNNDSIDLAGQFTTGLSFSPYSSSTPLVVKTGRVSGGKAVDSVFWNNTMIAEASIWDNMTSSPHNFSGHLVNTSLRPSEEFQFPAQPDENEQYQVNAVINSTNGSYSRSWLNQLNAAQTTSNSPAQTASASCTFTQSSNPVQISGAKAANATDTSVTLTWFSKSDGVGWANYNDSTDQPYSLTTTVTYVGGSWPYEYRAELHGLSSWGVYEATVGIGSYSGCLEYENSTSFYFQTVSQVQPFEYDYPYDSITQQGGGAAIEWQESSAFASIAVFKNGSATYFPTSNTTDTVVLPLPQLWTVSEEGWPELVAVTLGFNLTELAPNATYNVSIVLNYTIGSVHFEAGSVPFTFVYGRDTKGDGLTDWEKLRGWTVAYQSASGAWTSVQVDADPSQYATNGLVSDFVEKEFGLNPNTVDTAGSLMLDTWNLTFNLGPVGTAKLPTTEFMYWYQNNSYAFNKACPDPLSVSCSFTPLDQNASNVSDNSPWAAQVLWGRSALSNFLNLSGVGAAGLLRAVSGTYDGLRTLTVWGKLSWGANPLASSTPLDGVLDGLRVNPLYDEDVELAFGADSINSGVFAVNPNDTSSGCGSLPNDAGVALRFSLPDAADGFYGNNYSTQFFSACPADNASRYVITIPVDNTQASQTVQIQMWANISTNSSRDPEELPINGCHWSYNVTVGMFHSTALARNGSAPIVLFGDPGQGCAGANRVITLTAFGASEVPAGRKVNTWLWLPNDNSTVSNLPLGLKRYVGEEAFDLVVLDDTSSLDIVSDGVPLSWGGLASGLTLLPGLNEILVPRDQFMNSAFAQAILLNDKVQNSSVRGGPLLLGNQSGAITNSSHASNLTDLECYWQSRAVNQTPALCPRGVQGTWTNSTYAVNLVAAENCTASNCGGLPSIPQLETSQEAGAAVQAIVTLNVTLAGDGTGTQQLDALLAALLVNNSATVDNGTLLGVTNSVASLGFSSAVVRAMANSTAANGGQFGMPVSRAKLPSPPSCLLCWNTVSGVTYYVLSGQWVGVAWSESIAAGLYFVRLVAATEAIGAQGINHLINTLVDVGNYLKSEFLDLLSFIEQEAESLFSGLVKRVTSSIQSYVEGVDSSFATCVQDYTQTGSVKPADAAAFFVALGGGPFVLLSELPPLLSTALTILSAVSLGWPFLVSVLFRMMSAPYSPLSSVLGGDRSGANGYGPQLVGAGVDFSTSLGLTFPWNTDQIETFALLLGLSLGLAAFFGGVFGNAIGKTSGLWSAAVIIAGGISLLFSLAYHFWDAGFTAEGFALIFALITIALFFFSPKKNVDWIGAMMAVGGMVFLL